MEELEQMLGEKGTKGVFLVGEGVLRGWLEISEERDTWCK